MSDSPGPAGPSRSELEALVHRAVGELVEPLQAQMRTVQRALSILADRMPETKQVDELAQRIDVLTARMEEGGPTPLDDGARRAQTDDLRQALAVAVTHAVAKVNEAGRGDVDRLLERIAALEAPLQRSGDERRLLAEDLREAVATAIGQAVERVEAAHAADTSRVLDRVAALEGPLAADAAARQEQTDSLRKTAAAVQQALTEVEAARSADAITVERSLAQIEGAWATDAAKIERTLARIEAARAADTTRLHKQITTLAEPLSIDAAGRQAQVDEIRTAVLAATEHAMAQIEAARSADTARLLDQVTALATAVATEAETRRAEADQLRSAIAGTVEQAVAAVEATRAADTARLLDQLAALERPLGAESAARQAQIDDLRLAVAAMLDQVVDRVEAARAPDAAAVLDELRTLTTQAADDGRRREEQALALLAAVDDRLQSLHVAGAKDGEARADRVAERLEAATAEQARAILAGIDAAAAAQGEALLARLDERTAAVADLAAVGPQVAARVDEAAAALTAEVERLAGRLLEAGDALVQEGGRLEALARAQAEEARAAEERGVTLLGEVAERAEAAVDRSLGRITEGQGALGGRLEEATADLVRAFFAATDRLGTDVAERVEGLRAAGGQESAALLDAVARRAQQIDDGLAEVRATIAAMASDAAGPAAAQRAELAEVLDGLRATVEAQRQDSRLDVVIVEQIATRQAQLAAIDRVTGRIDEVGPLVARALLAEVERAARSASAAEDAVANLHPDALRAALGTAAEEAAAEVRAVAQRLDATISVLAGQVGLGLSALSEGQAGIRAEVTGLPRSSDERSLARIDRLDESLAAGLADLRASQAMLREVVQDGAHKAELAAIDLRGLRDRLTPHLAALAEATTRRIEADQAGFDAVLARLDKLLAAPPA